MAEDTALVIDALASAPLVIAEFTEAPTATLTLEPPDKEV
jgi:hypothetical protein